MFAMQTDTERFRCARGGSDSAGRIDSARLDVPQYATWRPLATSPPPPLNSFTHRFLQIVRLPDKQCLKSVDRSGALN
jgi:hypothetical protein